MIDLYLSVKIRPKVDINDYNENTLNEERKKLKILNKTSEYTLIEYIKTSIDILMNMKSGETSELGNPLDRSYRNPISPDPDPKADSIESPCIPSSLREIDAHNKLNGMIITI